MSAWTTPDRPARRRHRRWLEVRAWRAFDVDEQGRVLAGHDDTGTVQLVELADGTRTRLTDLPGAGHRPLAARSARRPGLARHRRRRERAALGAGGRPRGLPRAPGRPRRPHPAAARGGRHARRPAPAGRAAGLRAQRTQPRRLRRARAPPRHRRRRRGLDRRRHGVGRPAVPGRHPPRPRPHLAAADEHPPRAGRGAGRRRGAVRAAPRSPIPTSPAGTSGSRGRRTPRPCCTPPTATSAPPCSAGTTWAPTGSPRSSPTTSGTSPAGCRPTARSCSPRPWSTASRASRCTTPAPDASCTPSTCPGPGRPPPASWRTCSPSRSGRGTRRRSCCRSPHRACRATSCSWPPPPARSRRSPPRPTTCPLRRRCRSRTGCPPRTASASRASPTRPARAATGSAVVVVHGGPEGQSVRTFNPVVQSLAAAGHAVLVPNVRGSTGYGRRWYSLDDGPLRLDSVADLAAVARVPRHDRPRPGPRRAVGRVVRRLHGARRARPSSRSCGRRASTSSASPRS